MSLSTSKSSTTILIPFLVVVQNPKKKNKDDDDDDDDGLQIVEFHHHFYPKNFCVVVEKVVDVVSKPKLPEEKKFLFCFAIIGIVVGVGRSEEDDSSRR